MSNYHLFTNYCHLYQRLCKEARLVAKPCEMMGDFQLLSAINDLLKKMGCLEMERFELERELN